MKYINTTPHSIFEVETGRTFPSSEHLTRVSVSNEFVSVSGGVRLFSTTYGVVTGLPASEDGVLFIVSALVKLAANKEKRFDVVSPGELLRDENGNPVGCRGFSL